MKRGGYVRDGENQKLLDEGFELEQVGEKYAVVDYKLHLVSTTEMLQFSSFILQCPRLVHQKKGRGSDTIL